MVETPRNLHDLIDKISINLLDIRDENSIQEIIKGHDFLFNLAGQTSHLDSMENPFLDLEINAKAQLSILEGCRRKNPEIRVVFASTRQIYGKPKYLPVDENIPSTQLMLMELIKLLENNTIFFTMKFTVLPPQYFASLTPTVQE